MVVFKRGGSYWADFAVNGQRFRLPLKVTNKQEAANLEKLKIAEAQSHGGLLPSQTARLSVADAGVVYFSDRAAEVSPSTSRCLQTSEAAPWLREAGLYQPQDTRRLRPAAEG